MHELYLNESCAQTTKSASHVNMTTTMTPLNQAVADGVLRANLKRSCPIQPDALTGFKKTAQGGCFKQGSNGKFVKKTTSRSRQAPERLQPAYVQASADNRRPFRPKASATDLKRSVSHLRNSLRTEREKHGQVQLQCCALESEISMLESAPARGHIKQLSASLEFERQGLAKTKSTAQQLRRERDAARSQVLTSESTMSAQAALHKAELAKMEFQHEVEMEEFKASVQEKAKAAIADAHNDKQDAIAKAQAQAQHYRQHWTKAHVQKSRLQLKLNKTVEHFETKASGVKSRNKKDVKGLLAELQVLVTSSACDRSRSQIQQAKLNSAISKMQAELDAVSGPICTMKNGRDFSDEIVLLSWELMAMGVSSNIVGDVEALCCEHLAHRKLERKPSKSTTGRWAIQSKDIAMHHLGELLSKNAERGLGYATNTTTVRSAERAANNFELRLDDGEVLKLRGPVNELASHTADEQMKYNIEYILSDTRRVMETAGVLGDSGRVSVAYFVTVMGDHVNEALWNKVEAAKFVELDRLIREKSITEEVAAQMRMFTRTKCSKHKLAKLSRDACNAMVKLQDPAIAAFTNMVGKTGRTYESLGYKLVEVVSWQFSCDMSVANPHGHSQDFQDWQDMLEQESLAIPNTNKNRHYRHERNARKLLEHFDNILMYLADVRDGRDEKEHPNKETKIGNADSRIWKALHFQFITTHKLEAYAQLVAMDMLQSLFYGPALCMVCHPTTDVVNVGVQWRAAYDWLTEVVPSKTNDELMHGGRGHRCHPTYHKKDKTQAQMKSIDELEFKPPIALALKNPHLTSDAFKSRSVEYFRAAAKQMAASILEIAPEYFPAVYKGTTVQKLDGELFNPSAEVIKTLSGFICENDFCEAQLGDERQMLTKAAGKISMTAVSGLNMMRHNSVIADIQSGRVANVVSKRGKLAKERRTQEGSEKERRVKMRTRVEAYRSVKRKEVMQRAQNRRAARAVIEAVPQFLKRSDVDAVLSPANTTKPDEKVKAIKDQLKIYRDLIGMGMKAVPMSQSLQVPAPGGRMKKKQLRGTDLLQWLCGNLLKLMAKAEDNHGTVKPWRDIVAANPDCGSAMVLQGMVASHKDSQAFVEECEDPESDTDVATTGSAQIEVFSAEENAPPEFEELADDEEGESDEEYEPKEILDIRKRSNRYEYLIHWKGYQKSAATWEPRSHVASCSQVLKAWEKKMEKRNTSNPSKRPRPSASNANANKSKKNQRKKKK